MNKYLKDIMVPTPFEKVDFKREAEVLEQFRGLFERDYFKEDLIKLFLEEYPCYKREDIKDISIEKADDDKITVNIQLIPTLEFVDIDFIIGGN